jgi:hypothetical protein
VPNKAIYAHRPVVFSVPADTIDEELDELALFVVAQLDAQAAEQLWEETEPGM